MTTQPELPLTAPDLTDHRAAVAALLRDAVRLHADGLTVLGSVDAAFDSARAAVLTVIDTCRSGDEESLLARAAEYVNTPF